MSFYTEWDAMFGQQNWKFEQASGSLLDDGSTPLDLGTIQGDPTEQLTGPITTAMNDYAIGFDGVDDGYRSAVSVPRRSDTSGCIGGVFRTSTTVGGYLFGSWVSWSGNRAFVSVFVDLDGHIRFRLQRDNSPSDFRQWEAEGVSTNDGEWHMFVIRQKNDGTGIEMWIDNGITKQTLTQASSGSTITDDSWINDALQGSITDDGTTFANLNGATYLDIDIALFGMDSTIPTDGEIDDLFASAPFLEPDYNNKSVRRKGRTLWYNYP